MFAFIMMILFEAVRLYLAYVGNLGERVPELTGFWLLTLMVEVPLSTFLLAIVWIPIGSSSKQLQIVYLLPLQFALQIIHAMFVYMEVAFGLFALRVLARYQISRFHYKQFDKNVEPALNQDDDTDWLEILINKNYLYMKSIDPDIKVNIDFCYFIMLWFSIRKSTFELNENKEPNKWIFLLKKLKINMLL